MSVRSAAAAAVGHFLCLEKEKRMSVQVIKGHIVHAPSFGRLDVLENGCIVLNNGKIDGVFAEVPEPYQSAASVDYGDRLIMPSLPICICTRRSMPCWAWVWICLCWIG